MLFFRKRKNTDRKRSTQSSPARQQATLSRLRLLRCEPLEDRRMLSITLFVDDDAASGGDGLAWVTAYDDLQSALTQAATLNSDTDAANDVDQIWIAEGVYKPSAEFEAGVPRSASFSLVDGVTLYGGFAGTEATLDTRKPSAHITTLSGNLGIIDNTSDNAYTVVYCGRNIETAIDSILITEGKANGSSFSHPERECGGGVYNAGNLTITNSTFSHNSSHGDGGGVYNVENLTIMNSRFSNNSTTENFSCGGGICNNDNLTIIDSTISRNSAYSDGGGICNSCGDMTIIDSTISGNSATTGGGIKNNANLTVVNTIISDNSAIGTLAAGGGIYNPFGDMIIIGSTISGNSATTGGGIKNNAIWLLSTL